MAYNDEWYCRNCDFAFDGRPDDDKWKGPNGLGICPGCGTEATTSTRVAPMWEVKQEDEARRKERELQERKGANVFAVTEETLTFRHQAGRGLSHLLGAADEQLDFFPALSSPENLVISKEARRDFSEREKRALIEEDGEAVNKKKLNIKGTHYENSSVAEIAQMILPMKGL